MVFERPLCVALDGFTLHAATRAGGLDEPGREALLKYILRPAVAQERVTRGPEGLVRIALKKAFSDGTVAIDLDPLSLLSRLCASVPPPLHSRPWAELLCGAWTSVLEEPRAPKSGQRRARPRICHRRPAPCGADRQPREPSRSRFFFLRSHAVP